MVKILSRDSINRMVGRKSSVAGVGGGGGDVDLSGYATKIWTQETFVSIDFFRSLFRAYDSQNHEILPNDTTSTIDNIKAMFGFWTEQYLSALGQGTGGGGGGGAEALSDLLDVELTTLQNGQALVYSSTLGKWTNGTAGVNMTQVWSALDSATNEQINVSHLTNALSGYVTTSAISDMATQTWVGQQGYATKTWVNQNFITIAFFDRLFQAYEGTGSSAIRVNPNDTTSTIDNVKAMFGFWTEQYISALGQGASGGTILTEPLQSINNAGLGTPQTAGVGLVWNGTAWTYGNTGGSGDVTWTALAAATNEQINASHLSTALGEYLPLSGGTMTGMLKVEAVIFGYNYHVGGNNAAAFVFDKPNSYNTGIGAHATNDTIWFGACNSDGTWIDSYKQIWDFNGTIKQQGNAVIHAGNIGSQRVTYATSSGSATKLSTARTIWGQSFDGRGNVSGNMTGVGTISASGDIGVTKSSGETNVFVSNNNGKIALQTVTNRGLWDFTSSKWLIATNGTDSWLNAGNVGIGTTSPSYKLHVNGSSYLGGNSVVSGSLTVNAGIELGNTNEINGTAAGIYRLHLNYSTSGLVSICYGGGNCGVGTTDPSYKLHVNGSIGGSSLSIANGGRIDVQSKPSGATMYIGNSNNAGWVRLQDMCGAAGTAGDASGWSIRTSGNALFANVQSNGYVTALSDARHKTIINTTDLQVEQIARMPAVVYRWNDGREDNGLHVGSIAQDWQRILPEVVLRANDKEGTLSMQYGVAALVSSIITARKVVDHEQRIAELERENKELKMKLKIA